MRIWDVHPAYLSRESLLGEHALLHGLAARLRGGRQHNSAHPETARWQGCGWALGQRHRLVVAEMALRGFAHRSKLALRTAVGTWPAAFVDPPADQLVLLAAKYQAAGQAGRLALPRTSHELWAQHKYSVLAREQAAYRELGRRVGELRGKEGFAALALELVGWLRRPPPAGHLRNAVEHMWGHVDAKSERPLPALSVKAALRRIGRLAQAQSVAYLLAQTALTDLAAWPTPEDRRLVPRPRQTAATPA